jgi:hypothetical protein
MIPVSFTTIDTMSVILHSVTEKRLFLDLSPAESESTPISLWPEIYQACPDRVDLRNLNKVFPLIV